jgi:hypothetical protein
MSLFVDCHVQIKADDVVALIDLVQSDRIRILSSSASTSSSWNSRNKKRKLILFPDNKNVLYLIDMKHTGVMAMLDEQCILPKSSDVKFTRYIYASCNKQTCFQCYFCEAC